jgi:putative ABC transport system ATP-binding protein
MMIIKIHREYKLKFRYMISLKNIEKIYQTDEIETVALSNITLDIAKAEFVSIMGPSGCGKSTLLNLIGLLDLPTKGVVQIDNQLIEGWKDKKLAAFRNQKLGFIFQSFHLINDLLVVDNVELPLLYRKGVSGKERREKALEALEKVGLSSRSKHYPSQLSGGQKQRVAIARAIVGHPEIILADEPTGNLDSKMGLEILEILQNLNKDDHATIVMVTHDENMAKKTGRIIHLFDGMQVN